MKKLEIALIAIVVLACIFRFFTKVRDDTFLAPFKNQEVVLEGVIVEEPEIRMNGTRVRIDVRRIKVLSSDDFVSNEVDSSLILSTVRTSLDPTYGDVVSLEGRLEKPEIIVDDDGRSFDYPHYLGKDRIYYLLKGGDMTILERHEGNKLKEHLLKLKHAFIGRLNDSLPEPHSLLASGLVVAGKGALTEDLNEQFKRVGLIHIVVLSGSNVTIIAEAISKSLSFLPKFFAATGGVLGIIAFTVIAGTSATVVRSAIMSIIALIGHTTGRRGSALRALIVAACGMVLINPDIVIYDPSFQLSFTGTLGLITLGETVKKWFMWLPERFAIREIVSASIASQISITPMILHMSGMFSVVSLLVNILVLPFIPLTMLFVFLAGCLGFISQIISTPFVIVSYAMLSYVLSMVSFFSSWKFAAMTISSLSWLEVACIYLSYVVAYVFYRAYKKSRPRGTRLL